MWEDLDLCSVLNKASTCVGLLLSLVSIPYSTKFSRDKIFEGQNFWPFPIFWREKLRILADHAHLWPLCKPIY